MGLVKSKNIKLFTPHKGQEDIITDVISNDAKWQIIVTGRQFGKTLMVENLMLYFLLKDSNMKGCFISPYLNQAAAVYDEIILYAKDVIRTQNSQSKKITFTNGSTLQFLSGENLAGLRGYTMDYGAIDEAAFLKSDIWHVLRPVFAVHGKKVLVISTPYIKNTFYDYYQLGLEEDQPNYRSYHAISTDNPFFPITEIEEARRLQTEEEVNQEYFAKFLEGGGDVFKNFGRLCLIENWLKEDNDKNEEYFAGVDIALGGKDKTCVVIMNEDGDVVFIDRWRESITTMQIELISNIFNRFNIVRSNVEINQERGIQQALSREYRRVNAWETTTKTKPQMIQNLKKDIEDGVVTFPTRNLDPILYSEFSSFSQEHKNRGYIEYSAPEGAHDDTVIAVALANEARVPNRYKRKFKIHDI